MDRVNSDIPEGYNIYTYNQYSGNPPQLSNFGLPPSLADATLPTQIPRAPVDQPGMVGDSLPYSPAFIEMAARGNGAVPHVNLAQPKQPSLWNALGKAILKGTVSTNSGVVVNSAQA